MRQTEMRSAFLRPIEAVSIRKRIVLWEGRGLLPSSGEQIFGLTTNFTNYHESKIAHSCPFAKLVVK